jgi:hypothetical protein
MSAATRPTPGLTGAMAADPWRLLRLVQIGVAGGAVAIYVCLVGIVPVFAVRPLIIGIVELGQAALLITFAAIGYVAARDRVEVRSPAARSPARSRGRC